MEKPFGTDLVSPAELNAHVQEVFAEEDVFRIDHFLGKEAAQNILAFRFANGLFEPIWNRQHIDHVQIDVPETLVRRHPRRVLRVGRRVPRHGRHPPVPDPGLRRDGTADRARARSDQRGEEQGLPLDAPDRPHRRGPRPVRGLQRHRRRVAGLPDRDLRRAALRDRQLAVGRGAVLPAHRQGDGRGRTHRVDRVPGTAQEHVPARVPASARSAPTTSRSTWPTRPSCRCRSTASSPGPAWCSTS